MSLKLLSDPDYLAYSNQDVMFRFSHIYDLPEDEVLDLFQETKKFIAICTEKDIYINDDLLIIDEMWHNFILFTPVYAKFCERFFGRFVHHIPTSKKTREEHRKLLETDPERARREFMEREERLISTVYDLCGEDTVVKWFQEYPEKYTKAHIRSLQK